MSFILDALKKSEKERQRAAVPGISDLPLVVHQPRASAWLVTAIAVFGIGVVALTWAWWRTSAPAPLVATAAPPSVASDVPARSAALPTQAATLTSTRSLANEATRIAARTPQPDAPTGSAAGPRGSAPTGIITASPISILEARAAGMAVPELALELLVFSSTPSRRFVYINSRKYAEGDSLDEGPRLVEITTEGAILSYRGTDFLLPQN